VITMIRQTWTWWKKLNTI